MPRSDAKRVSRLHQSRISAVAIIPLVLAGGVTIVAAIAIQPAGQTFLRFIGTQLETFWSWLTGLF
jgi:hypothetical protein